MPESLLLVTTFVWWRLFLICKVQVLAHLMQVEEECGGMVLCGTSY